MSFNAGPSLPHQIADLGSNVVETDSPRHPFAQLTNFGRVSSSDFASELSLLQSPSRSTGTPGSKLAGRFKAGPDSARRNLHMSPGLSEVSF